jgi:D-glycero-alpha-D-manno-heptose-7-phosphate kinase
MELLETSVGVLTGQGDIRDFGRLLHEAWAAKRSLSNLVSNTEVDSIYREAQAAGALGGKLTGAGGGGFMLLFVPPEAQTGVRERLARLIQVPFSFAGVGSQIIFYDEEEDFGPVEKSRTHQHIGSFRELFEDGVDPKGAG